MGCILTFEDFMDKNTYFLSPPILRGYLFSEDLESVNDIQVDEINDYCRFIVSIKEAKNEKQLYELLINNEKWLDRLIRFTIASYESLGRLFVYLTRKYNEDKIIDYPLKGIIETCKGRAKTLPSDSQSIKKKFSICRELIAFTISLMYFGKLSSFFKEGIENGDIFDSIMEELKVRYEEPCNGFKKLLDLITDTSERFRLADVAVYLYHSYNLISKGEFKA